MSRLRTSADRAPDNAGHFGQSAPMMRRVGLRVLGLAVLAVCFVACSSEHVVDIGGREFVEPD